MPELQYISQFNNPAAFLNSLKEGLNAVSAIHIKVGGFSMFPVIQDQDTVILEETKCEDIKKGDIIFLKNSNNHIIAHRVIEKKRGFFITKGDASLGFDGKIPREDVIGRINAVIREGKTIELDKILCYRVIKACNVDLPHFVICFRRLLMFYRRASDNLFPQLKNIKISLLSKELIQRCRKKKIY